MSVSYLSSGVGYYTTTTDLLVWDSRNEPDWPWRPSAVWLHSGCGKSSTRGRDSTFCIQEPQISSKLHSPDQDVSEKTASFCNEKVPRCCRNLIHQKNFSPKEQQRNDPIVGCLLILVVLVLEFNFWNEQKCIQCTNEVPEKDGHDPRMMLKRSWCTSEAGE